MSKSLIAVVNSQTKTVVYWKVVSNSQADKQLDIARKKYKTPTSFEQVNGDLKDTLWVEDDTYDYRCIVIPKGQTTARALKVIDNRYGQVMG